MEILNWIGENISEIKDSSSYSRYFEASLLEKGIDVYMLFNPLLGIDLILTETYDIKAIHFYSGKEPEVNQFSDKLPFDLSFTFSRFETRQILGFPNTSGGGDFSFLYGITPQWDKYFCDGFNLHLQFSEGESSIELITLDSQSVE
ncbi:hypothetical protein [Mucilaginibacter sp.]|uniref:hypothetical protein n=1 Tax=Mucilaginibacter sp. TaxID=1882438 RepID=UPI0025DF7398|nr:hypothetical protein [Mucilaginibacter sp.]